MGKVNTTFTRFGEYRWLMLFASVVVMVTSCTEVDQTSETVERLAPSESSESSPVQSVDVSRNQLANTLWTFDFLTNDEASVRLIDGRWSNGPSTLAMGEFVQLDLNGDQRKDAVVQIETIPEANFHATEWYAWIATNDQPVQVLFPIAKTWTCEREVGDFGSSRMGFEIYQPISEVDYFGDDCSHTFLGDPIHRTIAVVQEKDSKRFWPVQVAPRQGFGGVCPLPAENSLRSPLTDLLKPDSVELFAIPDSKSEPISDVRFVRIFELSDDILMSGPSGWVLRGIADANGENTRCAWVQTSD